MSAPQVITLNARVITRSRETWPSNYLGSELEDRVQNPQHATFVFVDLPCSSLYFISRWVCEWATHGISRGWRHVNQCWPIPSPQMNMHPPLTIVSSFLMEFNHLFCGVIPSVSGGLHLHDGSSMQHSPLPHSMKMRPFLHMAFSWDVKL